MRLLQDARLVICFSFVLTLFVLTNFPHAVLGSEFLYDEEDGALVIEVKALDGLDASTKPRIVEFYSPYCVSMVCWMNAVCNIDEECQQPTYHCVLRFTIVDRVTANISSRNILPLPRKYTINTVSKWSFTVFRVRA